MKNRIRIIALLLALILCIGTLSGCKAKARTVAGFAVEENEGRSETSYPYIVHTPHATWYLAAADIELLGEDAFFAGLENILTNQEADFSDAIAALSGYTKDEIPVIDVHTDFAAQTERAKWNKAGAYYLGPDTGIYLYNGWDMACNALLHEYTHYLTMECCTFDLSKDGGFWAEAVAEYVSMFVCTNRMWRGLQASLSEQDLKTAQKRGITDADGSLNAKKYYCYLAAYMRSGAAIGEKYSAVSETPITLSERLIEHPQPTTISYFEAGSFFNWLTEHYGKDLVFTHMTIGQEGFKEVFGEDFEALFFRWAADNDAWCTENGIVLGPMEE